MTQLMIALDEPTLERARDVFRHTAADVQWYKVGYQAYFSYGEQILTELREARRSVFLDLKLHDIPNTVAAAIRTVARSGASLISVHAGGGRAMLTAAATVRDELRRTGRAPKIVAVTMLTSLVQTDLQEIGIDHTPHQLVSMRSALAQACGLDGVVCAVDDVPIVRLRTDLPFMVVCPGIRASGEATADQKRTATPSEAVLAGADYIVVGRPITKAPDPRLAVRAIMEQIEQANAEKPASMGSV